MTEYTDTSVYYILYFPYFPVPQPVEKCIQLQLIQTELDPVIGVTTPCLVTVSSRFGSIVFSRAPLPPASAFPPDTPRENPYLGMSHFLPDNGIDVQVAHHTGRITS